MKTNAAVLWEQPGEWKVIEIELDDPGPTEILVEMVATGLCHSDEHFAVGDMPCRLPMIGGHEGSGIVRAVGAHVRGLAVGDHVITSFAPACGECRWCSSGLQNLCDNGANILEGTQPAGGFRAHANGADLSSMGALGTFAEWQVFDQMSVMPIDRAIPLDVACLVSCGVQTGFGSSTNAGQAGPGDVVLIMGAGGVGMNAVQGAHLAGADHVVVVDPAPYKREQAPSFGATATFADFDEALEFVRSVTNGQGADAVIVTIGRVLVEHVAQGLQATRKGGVLVVTGLGPDQKDKASGISWFELAMYQKRIQGALYGMASPREAMPKLLKMYQNKNLKLDELITRRYSLDQINQGYHDMHEGINLRGIIEFTPGA